ncbi:type I methionyl aminopeptidase [Promicromonospora thailandica]|uniref:Methionine aminopeptidase n=1 Tax=Promicromonospora thailandica TaxID=765201 RepID=A0A9X2G0I8_9MICO|nr:type I methionyl aminopeptidase [Promicromonospora thailandica]MCP2264790.1 methionyl aminopeptidase [Promicromonospora thailandica]BFF18963.1 type I methionyl aminopeptidase [Promicromonospora thailandica]
MVFGRERIEYKTPDQVRLMRRAGLVVADTLAAVRAAARPGLTTAELDAVAARSIEDAGAAPSFLGYHGFPGVICTSVNEEVIHGIPGSRVLAAGDLVSIDCGAVVEGWHGDSAVSFVLGAEGALDHRLPDDDLVAAGADLADIALVRATEAAMWAGIAALASAKRLNAVGEAVEAAVEMAGEFVGVEYGIVEEYVGHGIGSAMHQPPDVHNYRTSGSGPRLRSGMCLAIEPMITRGGAETQVLEDGWTVVTTDGSRAAHWEHSTAITEDGIVVLTAADGGAERLGVFGVTPVEPA